MTGYICGPKLYKFQGATIEDTRCGLWASNREGEPYKRIPAKVAKAIDAFCLLSEDEREAYRVGGGCHAIDFPCDNAETVVQ